MESVEDFKIGDKVVFKKEILDEISKSEIVLTPKGIPLTKEYYHYVMENSNFEKLKYFEVRRLGVNTDTDNINIVGLDLSKDLFEHYQEEYFYKNKTGDELNKLLDSKKESDLTTIKNYQNNEIKFQRAKVSCKRGVVPTGSTISGRKDKIAISIGHLSYQVCNC